MSEHKNKNEAKGNFCIYRLSIWESLYKFGKADTDRITQTSGEPTRIHQQKRELAKKHGDQAIDHDILFNLEGITTQIAKEIENKLFYNNILNKRAKFPKEIRRVLNQNKNENNN